MYFDAYAHSLRSLKCIIDDWNYHSVGVDGKIIMAKGLECKIFIFMKPTSEDSLELFVTFH